MSEPTKRTSHLTPFYLPSPDMADSAERDLWERLHRDVPPRPSTFAAEGGAEDETTNSPAEIGTACTGRKTDPTPWFVLPLMLVSMVGFWCEIGGVPEIGLAFYGLFAAFCGFGLASGFFSVVRGGGAF